MAIVKSDAVDLDAFRKETRTWLEVHTPPGWKDRLAKADEEEALQFFQEWARVLHSGGLLVANWPQRFGGRDATFAMQVIIQQEMTRADAPRPRYLAISIGHAAATLIAHGTPAQRELLAGILEGDVWCQGFSEPNAGSDLAALRTRAERDGDHYVINGQKVWSSMGIHARWCLLLARTDQSVPKHKGISCFILDMHLPGVEVRPIRQATGASEFAEVFLTDVLIPATMLVGAENDGWRIAQTTLVTERYSQMIELEEGLRSLLDQMLREAAERPGPNGRPLLEDAAFRREVGKLASEVEVLGLINNRVIGSIASGEEPGPEGSILKLYFSELLQRLTRVGVQSKGIAAHIDPLRKTDVSYFSGDWMLDHIRSWTWTIAAGSNEIQRNIIGERVLGLPREPRG